MPIQDRWQPPRFYTDATETQQHALEAAAHHGHEERKVSWLELFYDLVYVITLILLGDMLSDDVSLFGFLRFFLLFIPIWWSWTGVTLYTNRFVADDIWHRVLIFTQIFFVAALGLSIQQAWGPLGAQFTIAYVGIRLVLVILYLRAARHVPDARELANRYATGFFIAALVWLSAIFVPAPYRPYLWLAGMVVDFLTPLSARSRLLNQRLPVDVPHLTERYGLFIIIVLGESFVKVVSSASGLVLTPPIIVFGVFALTITCLLWWLYFDDVAEAVILPTSASAYIWLYAHLPIALSLVAFGVGVKKLLQEVNEPHLHDEYRWLISVAMILYLAFVGLINAVTVREDDPFSSRVRGAIRLGGGALILLLALFGGSLSATPFVAIAAAIFIAETAVVLVASRRKLNRLEPEHSNQLERQ